MLNLSTFKRGEIMGLKACPDCGKMISDSTNNCPSCGCQLTNDAWLVPFFACVIVIGFFVLLFVAGGFDFIWIG